MNVAAVDLASLPEAARRPQLFRLTLQRELSRGFVIVLLLSPVVTLAVAGHAAGLQDDGGMIERLIRRFDLSALGITVLACMLRTGVRMEHDARDSWLDVFMATGARGYQHTLGVLAGTMISSAAVFIAVAVTFAVGVRFIAGTSELLSILHVTVGSGLYLILRWTLWAAMLTALLRSASLSFGVAVVAGLTPLVLVGPILGRNDVPSAFLLILGRLAPPLTLPTPSLIVWHTASAAAMAAILLFASQRLTGRRV